MYTGFAGTGVAEGHDLGDVVVGLRHFEDVKRLGS